MKRGAKTDARLALMFIGLPCAVRESSRVSQVFANFQSRMTVSGDTFSTSAVSSTLKPPKNRSSTTWLCPLVALRERLERLVNRDQIFWSATTDRQPAGRE